MDGRSPVGFRPHRISRHPSSRLAGSQPGESRYGDAPRPQPARRGRERCLGYDRRLVSESPIEQLLRAIDELDVDAAMALVAPDVRFLAADGRRGEGAEAARKFITDF